ncbi:MAG: hypothetical protein E5X65_34345 [Mesorhizobium sp.]|nr:MAG: hypothetical protein E5X65_34345 [Mesorhizobium sp.]
MKRDLYERPGHQGYTGIRDNAGRFTLAEAKDSVRDGQYGVTLIRLADAPEFTNASYDDVAREHLRAKIAKLQGELARAAAHIAHLEERALKAEEALEPFGAIADIFDHAGGNRPTTGEIHSWADHRVGERVLTVEMLRAARSLASEGGKE